MDDTPGIDNRMSKRLLTVILTAVALGFYGGFILLTIYRAQ